MARADRTMVAMAAIVLIVAGSLRLVVDWDTPIWVDEVWTGTIARQPSLAGLFYDTTHEIGGPVYYGFIWGWAKLFGVGNTALRVPSVVFALLAPVLALYRGHERWRVRTVWACLLILWIPIFYYATEARSYSLAYLLAVAQVIAFRGMLAAPTFRRALIWCAISTTLILTHYHALVLTGFQGVTYLAMRPRAAARQWPAALPFAIAGGWMLLILPIVAKLTQGSVTWQPAMTMFDLKGTPLIMLGGYNRGSAIVLAVIAAAVGFDVWRFASRREQPYAVRDLAAGATAVAAILLVFGLGFLRPSFAQRYLIPYFPGALFMVAVVAERWRRRFDYAPLVAVALFAVAFAGDMAARYVGISRNPRWLYSWQQSADEVRRAGTRRLIFFLDNPVMAAADRDQLTRVARFFFDREGYVLQVEPLVLAGRRPLRDPATVLRAMAAAGPGRAPAGFIWIYDDRVGDSLAVRYPPRLPALADRWRCRFQTRDRHVRILLCVPR